MSRSKLLSTAGQLAGRTMMMLVAAGLVIACVILPAHWTGASQRALQQDETGRLRIPPQYRERVERERRQIRERPAPMLQGARLMLSQLVGVAVFAWLGRRIFRFKLKR